MSRGVRRRTCLSLTWPFSPAIASAESEIQKAQGRGDREIKFIVGQSQA